MNTTKVTVVSLQITTRSIVNVNGHDVTIDHSRLLSKNGRDLQICRVHGTSRPLTRRQLEHVRAALEAKAAECTKDYRELKNKKQRFLQVQDFAQAGYAA